MLICLTGTIAPSKNIQNLRVHDPQIRLREYIDNILHLIIFSHFQKIVFCENSGFSGEVMETVHTVANLYKKEFEFITFNGNHKLSEEKGRGYGEQEILEYFFRESNLLKTETCFYKLTGRYKIVNIDSILETTRDSQNIFTSISPWDHRCSTAFFKTSKDFFEKTFIGCGQEVLDSKGEKFQLEGIYAERLTSQQREFSGMKILPIFEANTGSGYNLRKNWIRDTGKQLLNSLGFYHL